MHQDGGEQTQKEGSSSQAEDSEEKPLHFKEAAVVLGILTEFWGKLGLFKYVLQSVCERG